MTIAIMQPYFFPYIGYWQLIKAVDTFVIFDDVNYINKGYINRNNILVNGQKQLFTLELIGASQNRLINEIEVGSNQNKMLKTISMSYKKAPCFSEVFPIIESILMCEEKNLSKYLGNSLKILAEYLNIKTRFLYSSDILKDNELKGEEKIIDIVKRLNTSVYINAIGGQELYDREVFAKNNLELYFLNPKSQEYKQFKNEFIPNLSIIDLMMFAKNDDIQEMLNKYTLI